MSAENQSLDHARKRVLFVITQSEFGGAQRFLFELLSHLDQDKYEPWLAIGQSSDHGFTSALHGRLNIFNLRHLRREIAPWHDLLAVRELRKLIKKINPDILFLNSSKAGFIGALAKTFPSPLSALRVIYRIGGWTFNDPWPPWKKWLWMMLEKFSAPLKDVIIVNNQHDREQAKILGIRPKESLALIHNGLDVYKTEFLPREEARLKLFETIAKKHGKIFTAPEGRGSPNEIGRQVKYIIGTIANFYPPKGLSYLITAAERFRDNDEVAFVIIGDGEERPLLEKLIAEKRLTKKVFLMGRIAKARELLPAFDAFVLPSVKEGFPWVVLEAMAAKVPVIATNVGAVPEIITDGENGLLVKPRHTEALASKIEMVLGDDHLRQELGIKGHQTVLFKFGLDKMLKQVEATMSKK